LEEDNVNEFDDDTAEDDSVSDDEDCLSADSETDFSPSGRRAEEITAVESRLLSFLLYRSARINHVHCIP